MITHYQGLTRATLVVPSIESNGQMDKSKVSEMPPLRCLKEPLGGLGEFSSGEFLVQIVATPSHGPV